MRYTIELVETFITNFLNHFGIPFSTMTVPKLYVCQIDGNEFTGQHYKELLRQISRNYKNYIDSYKLNHDLKPINFYQNFLKVELGIDNVEGVFKSHGTSVMIYPWRFSRREPNYEFNVTWFTDHSELMEEISKVYFEPYTNYHRRKELGSIDYNSPNIFPGEETPIE